LGTVKAINKHTNYVEIWVEAPTSLLKYIAHKGSITVDGVSLTVNEVKDSEFMLWLIPHTLQETIIGSYKVGTEVNLEVDLIARYLERLILGSHQYDNTEKNSQKDSNIDMTFLAENGYLKK